MSKEQDFTIHVKLGLDYHDSNSLFTLTKSNIKLQINMQASEIIQFTTFITKT